MIPLRLALLVFCFATLGAEDGKSYEQLVAQRLRTAMDAIARSPGMTSKKENVGGDIYKSLLLFHENKNLGEAEKHILNFCGNPLTTYVAKPVPQNRSEAMFRIYLTEKTRRLLSPMAKAVMEDYAWELLTHHQAWNRFWISYFEARAGQGADMEIAHPSSYRPPEILRAIARDPKRGPYLGTSRRALLIESEEKEKSGVIVFGPNGDSHFRRDVFHTPFLSMKHGENMAVIHYPGHKDVVLDFGSREDPASTKPGAAK